jgi:hypothetical protein
VKAVLDLQTVNGGRGESASVVAIERADRERRAYALHQQGWTFEAIAAELGYGDRSGARKAAVRGKFRWMRETDAGRRAGELERTEVLIALLWSSIYCAAPDSRAMDQVIKLLTLRAKLMGLFGKPVESPDRYAGAPHGAAMTSVDAVVGYQELMDKQGLEVVVRSDLGSGVAEPDDEGDDVTTGATSDLTVEDDGRKEYPDVADDMHWVDGKLEWDGVWIDGKFVKSIAPANDDDALDRPRPSPATQEHTNAEPWRAEAFNIDS